MSYTLSNNKEIACLHVSEIGMIGLSNLLSYIMHSCGPRLGGVGCKKGTKTIPIISCTLTIAPKVKEHKTMSAAGK